MRYINLLLTLTLQQYCCKLRMSATFSGVTVSLGAPRLDLVGALPLHFHKKSHAHKLRSQYSISITKKRFFLKKERAYLITQ